MVQTVRGPVDPKSLGVTLMHEHILVDFIGADRVSRDRYDPEEVFQVALPHLRRLRELGCQTLVECTPMFLGRDPVLLRRLSEASGLHLITNTGLYKAPYLPAYAEAEDAGALAARWLAEVRDGIEGTGIRPGFIKIAANEGPLIPVQEKIVRAAARVSRAIGLPIASHTTQGKTALQELDLLAAEGVAADAFIWVHAHAEPDPGLHLRAARRGAWVEFDGIAPETVAQHVELVMAMHRAGLSRRVLLSHDAGWYHVGEPGGGAYRGYDTLFTQFLPALRRAGGSEALEKQLLVTNPAAALTPRTAR